MPYCIVNCCCHNSNTSKQASERVNVVVVVVVFSLILIKLFYAFIEWQATHTSLCMSCQGKEAS